MPRAKSADSKNYSKRIMVLVKRDMTAATPKIIYSHEKPLLELVHGEGNVEEVDPGVLDEGYSANPTRDMLVHNKKQDPIPRPSTTHGIGHLFIGDRRMEYERLSEVYGRMKDENIPIVEKAYGRFNDGRFEDLLPPADLDDLPKDQLRGLLLELGVEPSQDSDYVKLAEEAGIETH